jgi:hypothetical protein
VLFGKRSEFFNRPEVKRINPILFFHADPDIIKQKGD